MSSANTEYVCSCCQETTGVGWCKYMFSRAHNAHHIAMVLPLSTSYDIEQWCVLWRWRRKLTIVKCKMEMSNDVKRKMWFQISLGSRRTKTEKWAKAEFQTRKNIRSAVKVMLKYLVIFLFGNHFGSPSCKLQTCHDVNHVFNIGKGVKEMLTLAKTTSENGVKYSSAESRTTMLEVAWLTSQFAHMCCSEIVRKSPTLSLSCRVITTRLSA